MGQNSSNQKDYENKEKLIDKKILEYIHSLKYNPYKLDEILSEIRNKWKDGNISITSNRVLNEEIHTILINKGFNIYLELIEPYDDKYYITWDPLNTTI